MKKTTLRDIAESLQALPLEDKLFEGLSDIVKRSNASVRSAAESLPITANPSDFLVVLQEEAYKAK